MKTLEDLTANPALSVVGSCILIPLGATVVYNARSFQKNLRENATLVVTILFAFYVNGLITVEMALTI